MQKTKALLFNFISYALLFFTLRYLGITWVFSKEIVAAILAAIVAMVLSPKFASISTDKGIKLVVKIPFVKTLKQLN